MSNQVLFIFKALDKYTGVGRKIASANEKIQRSFSGAREASARFNERMKKSSKILNNFGKGMSKLGGKITPRVSLPLIAMGGVALKQSANIESLSTSFRVLIGDAEKSKKVFKELIEFTSTTPFQLDNVANAGKQLLSFGVASEDLVPTLRMLGELSAATGKPLEGYSLIYGKVLAKNRIQGEEMLQLAEKGISLQKILADKYGVTGEQISEAVSNGQITFEIFNEALKEITREGGKFNGLTKQLSSGLSGLTSTLKDSTLLAFKELGDVLVNELDLKTMIAGWIVAINKFSKSVAGFARNHPKITKMLIALTGFLIILGPLLMFFGQLIVSIAGLSMAAGFLGTTLMGLSIPVLSVIALVGLLATAVYLLYTRWDSVVEGFKLAISDLPNFFGFILDSVLGLFGTSLADIRLKVTDMIEATVNKFKEAAGLISNFFEISKAALKYSLDSVVAAISEKFEAFKQKIMGFISGIGGKISGVLDFSSNISNSSSSVTDVNVNLNAPQGVIKNIKSMTTGKNSGLNVGINMAKGL